MGKFRYGCETFSWVMSGKKYIGKMPHICDIIRRAGFTGIEPSPHMMREYFSEPQRMLDLLEEKGLQLASIGFGGQYSDATLNEEELKHLDIVIQYLKHFPEPRISLSHGSGNRENLAERQQNALACLNESAKRAADHGITCAFHPTSGGYSIFRTPDDYKLMLDSLDTTVLGYCADSGHIINGGMDVYEIFTTYASIIRHVHLKDITDDKKWAPTGKGIIDFPRLMGILHDAGYDGWIDMEEESKEAQVDPDAATLKNGEYLAETLLPLGY